MHCLSSNQAPASSDSQVGVGTGSGASYSAAGVDIERAHSLLERVKGKLGRATRPEVLAPVGGFGGLFRLEPEKYKKFDDPVLVVSIDGVGTKLMVAALMDKYEGVGYDIVNHCINDVAVQGAEPLYFLDYLGIGRLRSPLYEQVLESLADACAAQNVALIGGETAEMPGMYGDDFDLVGCVTGIVERRRIISGDDIVSGDLIIGLAADGLHTNGYSLARRVLLEQAGFEVNTRPAGLNETVGDALLKPHFCYWPAIKLMLERETAIHGMAHITGGGWFDNIKRILPSGLQARCRTGVLPVPPIMNLIQELGGVERKEMYRTFNMGMGMAWIVPAGTEETALECCREAGVTASVAGRIEEGGSDETRVVLE